jgi:tetratricopeptide (TPR) repeat protein
MAAVPLVALLVAGSLWTQSRFNGTEVQDQAAPKSGAAATPPAMRSLGPQAVDSVAEKNLETAIAAEEAAHGRSTPAVARELVDLAGLLRADGRYAEAQALCERALIIEDQALGRKDPETIRTARELAAIYRAQGRNQDADAILTRADQP